MKTLLSLLAIVALVLGLSWWFAPEPDPELLTPRTDLPWQIRVNHDGSLHVFDLDIGHSTLAEAIAKFGPPERAAVFQRKAGGFDLEVYFGKVHFGPLTARVVVKLAAPEDMLRVLAEQADKREASPTGDWKFPLRDEVLSELANHPVTAISYVPGTRGLDQAFFLERFGEPAAWLPEPNSETARSWFYPDRGLSILIDDKGPEVLEYVRPADFRLPDGARPYKG
ncbi:hypothetical protein [endosymbiont of unidentified scaly snail isolate Monju]|uniref:hypothetical protein n=1 Tax=endosymbiont of unidentified scaly snail isolate Monju TaxID=1248727 RepID=UPI0003892396|nr:hypothetical protein [endosymbiont of unidentified scaly snail isolate Monju]BAN69981.1 conserved hypothetical protein [endosymbiont of unidentified scaly snail isolate Monju]